MASSGRIADHAPAVVAHGGDNQTERRKRPGPAAGARAGTLRADAAPGDVLRVLNGIWFLPDGPEWRETVGRMLDLVIDGLRYGAARSARRARAQRAP